MTVEEILTQVAQRDARLVLTDDGLKIDAPAGAVPSDLMEAIRANKAALLSQIQLQQQMCFNLVNWAVETVADTYAPGCLDQVTDDQRETIREVETAMDAAALAGDIDATDETTGAYVAAWKRIITEHTSAGDVLGCTIDEWCGRPDKPTIVLNTPHGEVLFVADRDAHARAVEAGRVVFSPLEVEQLLSAKADSLVNEELVRVVIETKRAIPGSKLDEVCKPGCAQKDNAEQNAPLPRSTRPPTRRNKKPQAAPKPETTEPTAEPASQLSLLGDGVGR